MSKSFFNIKNETDDRAEIYITGAIQTEKPWWEDEQELQDNYLKSFLNTLKDLKDKKYLDIHINSPGGTLFAGVNMYNSLVNHKAHKKVFVDGTAASAASLVAMAGDEIIIPKNAFLMIHKPLIGISGNANDLRKMAETLDTIEEGMLSIYEENLINKEDFETIKQMVNDETWLNGEEASKYFKNMNVTDNVNISAYSKFDFTNYKHTPKQLLEKEDRSIDINKLNNKLKEKALNAKFNRAFLFCKEGDR